MSSLRAIFLDKIDRILSFDIQYSIFCGSCLDHEESYSKFYMRFQYLISILWHLTPETWHLSAIPSGRHHPVPGKHRRIFRKFWFLLKFLIDLDDINFDRVTRIRIADKQRLYTLISECLILIPIINSVSPTPLSVNKDKQTSSIDTVSDKLR